MITRNQLQSSLISTGQSITHVCELVLFLPCWATASSVLSSQRAPNNLVLLRWLPQSTRTPIPRGHPDAEDIACYLVAHPVQYDASNIFLQSDTPQRNVSWLVSQSHPSFVNSFTLLICFLVNSVVTHTFLILALTENFPKSVYLACRYGSSIRLVERLKETGHRDVEFVGV